MASSNKKTFITLFIAFAIVGVMASSLGFDISNSIIQSNQEWTRVKIGLTGSPGPYQLSYDQYPEGWNPVLDYIYIPANQRTVHRKYPCRVSAKAPDGSEAKATIVFIVSNEGAYLSDLLFSYNEAFDDSFYNSGIFSGRPKLIKGTASQAGIIIPENAQFLKQSNIILKKLNSVSDVPGAGIADLLSGLSGNNEKIQMADVKASLKLRDSLANANLANSVSGAGSIQGAASAFNAAGTNLAVPGTITLNSDEKQLVLINQIRNTQIQEKTQERSIESIFFKLPGPQQLDAIITTADSFALIKTIQKVISSELSCQQKISYLSDFFGRIQSAISMKAFAATQLKVIIDSSQGQIDRLTKQITRNQQAINKLGVRQLRDKLTQTLKKLQIAYTNYNDQQTKVVPKVASIDVLRKNIQIIRSKSQSNRQQLPIQRLQLNEVNSNIARIEAQLREAIANRTVYQTNINKLTQSVSKYDKTIQGFQINIDSLEAQITNKQNEAQNLKKSYQTLEIQIERSRSQITIRQKRSAQINALIANLQQRLQIQQKKVNNTEISKIRTFVSALQIIVTNVTAQIDQVNFKCNQIKQVQTIKKENKVTYVIQPKQYSTYIQNCFKVKPDTKNIKVDKISLNPVSILNSAWTKTYGNPYQDDEYVNTSEFDFNQDFGCLSPSSLVSNSGLIVKISKRFIDVKVNDQPSRLNLGACSRLESTTDLPQVGQRIYFRGQKTQKNEYNLYRGSCM